MSQGVVRGGEKKRLTISTKMQIPSVRVGKMGSCQNFEKIHAAI